MKIDNKQEVINYINKLKDYQGYVQFSHRPIDKTKDIFNDKTIKIEDENGFIYEAHFYSEIEKKSIAIKQINDSWLVSITDISNIDKDDISNDIQEFITDIEELLKVKMAQIWEEVEDDLCENMPVKKLKKVVFAGFTNG